MNILKGFMILGAILFMLGALGTTEEKMGDFIRCITGMVFCSLLTFMINFIVNI